jgi:hypothetical protein
MASAIAVVTPRMLPIKQLSLMFEPNAPIQITLLAVLTAVPAKKPKAVLAPPVVLIASALEPMAVFWLPVVL